ncbi:MAG TPA: glutamate-5-semialdehyde dehydrogenase, partial [Thermoleophilia bacterium]|nr:glutamate-5-semialdehyde dehydrogenase [Thermoleophilia bacterium]
MSTVTTSLPVRARTAARTLAALPAQARDEALAAVAGRIEADAAAIEEANAVDVAAAVAAGQRPAIIDRLTLTPERIAGLSAAVRAVAALPDPIGQVLSETVRDDGLSITKMRVPLGVVMVVYEARPNVTVDAAALAIKSGNACILRGSRMASNTNAVLIETVRDGLREAGLPVDAVCSLAADHDQLAAFVSDPEAADVVIPRGGEELKHFLLAHSRIPVLAAAGGNCHVYVDESADADMAEAIVVNAKTHRPGVCNAAETLLVHASRPELTARLVSALEAAGVTVERDEQAWATEFLDMRIGLREVESLEQAIEHIGRYGTGHSEAIVTSDPAAAERFTTAVDAAAVYVNASTRFTDGGEYGMGAEIGISTNRLHAR